MADRIPQERTPTEEKFFELIEECKRNLEEADAKLKQSKSEEGVTLEEHLTLLHQAVANQQLSLKVLINFAELWAKMQIGEE
jgi:hypothetical protein